MPDIFLTLLSQDINCDPQSIPSLYAKGNSRLGKFFIEGKDENLNKEILKIAEQSGSFDFLSNPEEDIYTWGDGESLC